MKKILFGLMMAVCLVSQQCTAGIIGDNASDNAYNDGWLTGDNGGSGFNAWSLNNNDNPGLMRYAGHFIGDSTGLASPGANINVAGESFGMYANGNSSPFSTADRSFSNLLVGNMFSIDLAVNYRNGNKGFNLLGGAPDGASSIFNFNIGSDDYRVDLAASGNGSIGNSFSENTAFQLTFVQTSLSGGTWQISRSGGVSDSDSGTYSGLATGFQLYVNSTEGGNQNNFFANNMTINPVPEPTALLMVGLVGVAGLVRRRR